METHGVEIPSVLAPYMPFINPSAKSVKDSNDMKFGMFTPLLLEEVSFDGKVLGKIPQLKMEE